MTEHRPQKEKWKQDCNLFPSYEWNIERNAGFQATKEAFNDKSNTGRISQRHTNVHV
jgi:hypothetical protein